MKTKLVLWATKSEATASEDTSAQEQKVLVALELLPEENKINAVTIGGEAATKELFQQLSDTWRKGEKVELPESAECAQYELSANGELLPASLKAEKEDEIKRHQMEWLFIVLSTKLYHSYLGELDELQTKVEALAKYEKAAWDMMKGFWDKVQQQSNEKNLSHDHSEMLRERTNKLFTQLKTLRQAEDDAFETEARANFDAMLARIVAVEEALASASETFRLFEDLKVIQSDFKPLKLTKSLRAQLWERIDDAFKAVKGKRSSKGERSNNNNNGSEQDKSDKANNNNNGNNDIRLSRRIEGLKDAIAKMEDSIQRDKKELEFQLTRSNSSYGSQLESQLREVRTRLIQERIDSKNVKLDDMQKTLRDLDSKAQRQAAKAAKKSSAPAANEEESSSSEEETAAANNESSAEIAEPKAENEAADNQDEIVNI